MVCAKLQGFLLQDCHEWSIASAKRSDYSSYHVQEGRFANAQESCFQGVKR